MRLRMAQEPPADYVAFVGRHLEPLRREAARVVGADADADRLYPDVLTDVAYRWGWLDLRTHLHRGRSDVADNYLRGALVRRCQRWRAEDGAEPVMIEVWSTYAPPPPRVDAGPGPVARSSAATRLAAHLPTTRRGEVGALAEAAIAWCHAYEAHRRHRVTALVAATVLFVLWALHYLQSTA
jgi:hypothetical protein